MALPTAAAKAFSSLLKKRACRKYKRDERLDNTSRSQSAMGAAAKYLSAGEACKSAARVSQHTQVGLSENCADSTGRQRVIGIARPLK
jgi:hypothetical protein